MKEDKKELVVQSNTLIDNRIPFNDTEQKIFYSVLKELKKGDTEFSEIKIPITTFCEEWGLSPNNYYSRINAALVGLNQKVVEIHSLVNGKRRTETYSLIHGTRHEEGSGEVVIKLHDDMKPYLLNLSGNFTEEQFDILTRLSWNATRLYETLKRFSWTEMWTCDIRQFKCAMAIPEESYPNVSNLVKRVIEPAIDEINAKTDLHVSYKKDGRGEKTSFAFIISDLGEAPTNSERDERSDFTQSIKELWNQKAEDTRISKIKKMTGKRSSAVKARVKEYGEQTVLDVIDIVFDSRFLRGEATDWCADFDWVMKPNNFIKVYEGNYTDREKFVEADRKAKEDDLLKRLIAKDEEDKRRRENK